MPLNQSEIYDLLERVDRLPGLMKPRIGRWRAWPTAKPALYSALLTRMIEAEGGDPRERRRFTERARHAVAVAADGVRQIRDAPSSPSIALLTVPRIHRFPDGCERDAIYDELPGRCEWGLAPLILDYSWALQDGRFRSRPGRRSLDPFVVAAGLLRPVMARQSTVRRAAEAIAAIIERSDLAAALPDHAALVARAIAAFEARRRVFRALFRLVGARVVVLTDSPFKCGEVAAARELSLPVIELQHGMFGPRCPEYAWPAAFSGFKHEMPLPNRLFVFGELWRKLAVEGEFWTEGETPIAGAGAIDRYRGAARIATAGKRTRLVFMTQNTNRQFIVEFWRSFLELRGDRPIDVVIKVHPGEAQAMAAYASLARAAPAWCRIAEPTVNPFDLMVESDVVMSCNSYSLAEAIGLGRPTISLCGGQIPGGFAGTFVLPQLRSVMPHVGSAADLLGLLDAAPAGSPSFDDWRARTAGQGDRLYAPGFLDRASALLKEIAAGPNRALNDAVRLTRMG